MGGALNSKKISCHFKFKMSRKGRPRKFRPDFEPEPWYTDDEHDFDITVNVDEVEEDVDDPEDVDYVEEDVDDPQYANYVEEEDVHDAENEDAPDDNQHLSQAGSDLESDENDGN